MTFEKWLEEMKKEMAMEMAFPSVVEPVAVAAAEDMKDYIDEEDVEE